MEWKSDAELFSLVASTLYTPVLGDVLDAAGYRHQFLPQAVRPLRDDMRLVGRAMPVQLSDTATADHPPFARLIEALDQVRAGEIYLATGGSLNCAAWGEIMTATAKARGGAGAVIDGFHRDTPRVLEQNWPVFSRGCYAQDASVRSRVVDYRCEVEIAAVRVRPGDLVFGDIDGVLIVPREQEADIIASALEKARSEKLVRQAIEAGSTAAAAFQKYGVL